MSSQSSEDEAPQEVSFSQAETMALSRLRGLPSKKPATKKKKPRQTRGPKLDAETKAILDAGLDEEEERELARREAKFERSHVQTRRVALVSGQLAAEKKVSSNLKVVSLKRAPQLRPSDAFTAAKNGVLLRGELGRRPLRLVK